MSDDNRIDFVVESPSGVHNEATHSKGVRRDPRADAVLTEVRSIPVDAIKGNLRHVAAAATEFLSDIRAVGEFELTEVQLQVEVSAEGGVHFIGTAKAGGKGAITLTFSRPTTSGDKAK